MSISLEGQNCNECQNHSGYDNISHIFRYKKRDRKNELKDRDDLQTLKGITNDNAEVASQYSMIVSQPVDDSLQLEGGDDYQSEDESRN